MASHMNIVEACLVDGFGVEDIAVRQHIDVMIVRDRVRHLRATGRLMPIIEARLSLSRIGRRRGSDE